MEKVRNFLRNYLESKKFFSKSKVFVFSWGRENFQKVKNFQRNYFESGENFSLNFRIFFESENISLNFRIQT